MAMYPFVPHLGKELAGSLFKVLAVVGPSGSGKTTTAEFLIRKLVDRGYRVGAVKRIHEKNFSIDTPGTDTHRFARAGAEVIACASDHELTIIKRNPRRNLGKEQLREVLKRMKQEGREVVIVEGFHRVISSRKVGKIIAARTRGELDRLLRDVNPPVIAITGPVSNEKIAERAYPSPPVVNVLSEGRLALLEYVEHWMKN
jgi:molybdopterin-guanine dinucleotide biosynthesis protein MobB